MDISGGGDVGKFTLGMKCFTFALRLCRCERWSFDKRGVTLSRYTCYQHSKKLLRTVSLCIIRDINSRSRVNRYSLIVLVLSEMCRIIVYEKSCAKVKACAKPDKLFILFSVFSNRKEVGFKITTTIF